MGQPVVHFEIIGTDGALLRDYYSKLFGWDIQIMQPMDYGLIQREENLNADGIGIGGGVAGYEDFEGGVTIYVEVPDVEAALQQAESLGGERIMGPDTVDGGGPTLGLFRDPEGHRVGVVQSA